MGRLTVKDLDKAFPQFKMRMRREVVEWIKEELGKEKLRSMIYDFYETVMAEREIKARRESHKKQFKEIGVYLKDE